MVFTAKIEQPVNSFHAAYINLSDNDRIRIRDLILICCEISQDTFYRWLKDFTLIGKADRWVIAKLFNLEVKVLFNVNPLT